MGKRSAVCLQRRAKGLCCCTEHCSLQRKKLNLLYEDCGAYTKTMEQTLGDYGVMVREGLARGLNKNCGAFNSVVLTW